MTALLAFLGVLICFGVLFLYTRHINNRERQIGYVKDALDDNIYHFKTYNRTIVFRTEKIVWREGKYKIVKTRVGNFALFDIDKVLDVDEGPSVFSRLCVEIGTKEAIKVAKALKWKIKIKEM